MILYTVQDESAYRFFDEFGVLYAKQQYIFITECVRSYDYMRQKMRERIGKPLHKDDYPIWASLTKPNMRGYFYPHRSSYRITLDVDERRVLISDRHGWNAVWNFHPPYISGRKMDKFFKEIDADDGLKKLEQLHCSGENKKLYFQLLKEYQWLPDSWDKIFCKKVADDDKQACLWYITRDDVKKVEHFK